MRLVTLLTPDRNLGPYFLHILNQQFSGEAKRKGLQQVEGKEFVKLNIYLHKKPQPYFPTVFCHKLLFFKQYI